MSEIRELMSKMTLEESKKLLLYLAHEIFSVLDQDEKREFVLEMVDRTGKDKIGSMVQL